MVEETYATTLDPERYEALLGAWYAYVTGLPNDGDSVFRSDNVNAHFQRALAILDRMGRAEVRAESARLIASQMPGPALVMKPDGEILSVNKACLELLDGREPAGLADLEFDRVAVSYLSLYLGLVHEKIVTALLLNKSKSLRVVEPLYCSCCHYPGAA